MIEILDSNMVQIIEDRNETIQQTIKKLWQTILM